jgi:Acyltransferase family
MKDIRSDLLFKEHLSEDLYLIRGIAIALVVMGHVVGFDRSYGMRQLYSSDLSWLGWSCDFINILHMPVFLIASGIAARLFSRQQLQVRQFFQSKFQRLLVPLVVWSPLYFVFQSLVKSKPITLLGIFQATVQPYEIFWFLHALLFAITLHFVCSKLWQNPTPYYGISVFLAAISFTPQLGWLTTYTYWNLFFVFGIAIAPALNLLRNPIDHWKPATLLGWFGLSLVVLISVKQVFSGELLVYIARLINGPIAFLMLYIGLELGRNHQWKQGFTRIQLLVRQAGMLSMVIYLFHGYFTRGAAIAIAKVTQSTHLLLFPELHFFILSSAGILLPLLLHHFVIKRSALLNYVTGGR